MDGGYADHYGPFNGEEEEEEELYAEEPTELQFSSDRRMESFNNVDDSAGNDISNDYRSRDSSAGKLFVGGVAWETSGEVFTNYFCKYGEITDSVIMMDKITGRSRGFGFVTFADPAVANKVLEEDHVIDGRTVEVKKTVPREEMQERGVEKTRKIFVGGIPPSLTEDELKEYFSYYGSVAEHQIMFDRETGRSRGFGFVTFDEEDAVERIFSDGRNHELGGKQVEIKKAVPKRAGGDFASDGRMYRGGGSSKSYGRFSSGASDYGGGYSGKMGRGYGAYGGYGAGSAAAGAGAGAGAGGYGNYGGNYGAGAAGFYGGYGGYGYGFGFWGPMYGSGGYGGGGYGTPGGYGRGASYNAAAAAGGSGSGGGRGYGSGGSKGYGNAGAPTGRHHPYRK